MTDLKNALCAIFHTTIAELESKSKIEHIREARQVGMWYCIKYKKMPTTVTGRHFNRTHATAIHSYKTIENDMVNNKDLQAKVNRLFFVTNI